ncbi:MAG: DUF697 domain-containing protein [Desulfovibrionaceae bacterium]|nr:DUF697 domain-containing protein [Desulfovibrionaceae bacterium]
MEISAMLFRRKKQNGSNSVSSSSPDDRHDSVITSLTGDQSREPSSEHGFFARTFLHQKGSHESVSGYGKRQYVRDALLQDETDHEKNRGGALRLFCYALLVFGFSEAVWSCLKAFERAPWIGWAHIVGFSLLSLSVLIAIGRELRALRSLNRQQVCMECKEPHRTADLLALLPHEESEKMKNAVQRWLEVCESAETADEVRNAYSDIVLSQIIDPQAAEIIRKSALSAGMAVMASPWAAVDMLAVLFIGVRMTNRIASTYGMGLGTVARWRIAKAVLRGMTEAGAAELATDILSQAGARFAGILTAKCTQSLLAARCIIRLGIGVAEACRPVAFDLDNRLSAADILRCIGPGIIGRA